MPLLIGGEEHRRCPRRPILEQPHFYTEVFWHYRQIEHGILPEQGGMLDQANKLVECFAIVDSALSECQDEKARQAARKAARNGGWQHADRLSGRSSS